jgi:putative aldouronate transport system permease protein
MYDKFSFAKGYRARTIFVIFNTLFLVILCALMLIPLLKVLSDSFDAVGSYEIRFIPKNFTYAAYQLIVTTENLYKPFLISVFVTTFGTFLALLISTMCAYVLIQKEMPGRNFFTYMILITMIFNGGMIPTYLVMKDLHLLDTLWAVILPATCNTYNIILLKNFFTTIPQGIVESAEIDGCTPMKIYTKIVLPLSKAGLAAIGLFYAVHFWNMYFQYVIYINNKDLYNFQVRLREVLLEDDVIQDHGWSIYPGTVQNAAIVVNIIPVMILYPFLQKHFVKGVNLGAIKG